jgi:hypothetical protein
MILIKNFKLLLLILLYFAFIASVCAQSYIGKNIQEVSFVTIKNVAQYRTSGLTFNISRNSSLFISQNKDPNTKSIIY